MLFSFTSPCQDPDAGGDELHDCRDPAPVHANLPNTYVPLATFDPSWASLAPII